MIASRGEIQRGSLEPDVVVWLVTVLSSLLDRMTVRVRNDLESLW